MKKEMFLFFILFAVLLPVYNQNPDERQVVLKDIDSIRTSYHIPGLVYGVATCDSVLIMGCSGIREINTRDTLTINDYFHIASLGKGLTSFMTAKLVEEGMLSWDTGFFDLFPELKESSRQEYLDLTLKDLLSMRTTLRSLNDWSVKQIIDGYNEKYKDERFSYYRFAEYALTLDPVIYDSGQFYNYTSMGYVLANLMLQKASGMTYFSLLEKTNEDLGINFIIGWPQNYSDKQPSGHLIPAQAGWGESNELEVVNGDSFTDWGEDFLFYNIPSGHHSVSLPDYLKYLQVNLSGLLGYDNYLRSATYDFLFSGAKEYSMGWGNDLVNGRHYYSHSGSVGNYYANAIIIKEAGIVISIMANAGNGETKWGLLQIIRYLENRYVK